MGCFRSKPVISMQVVDRDSGSLINETVPAYLRSVYKLMYQNQVGKRVIKFQFTTNMLKKMTANHGLKMDSPTSATDIHTFISTYGVDVSECELPLAAYPTFNDFFARKLKPGARPIASPHDPHVLISPADCRLLVFPTLTDSTTFWLKGQQFTVASLLGERFAPLLALYADPSVVICRLAPNDYHRWHLPFRGAVDACAPIEGTYYSVSPWAVRENNVLASNKRVVCTFGSEECGRVALVAVGAAMVSSIILAEGMEEKGRPVSKGDMHGWFKFGGSTLVLLFEQDRVVFDADLVANSRKPVETYVRMGVRIGLTKKRAEEEAAQQSTATTTAAAAAAAGAAGAASPSASAAPSSPLKRKRSSAGVAPLLSPLSSPEQTIVSQVMAVVEETIQANVQHMLQAASSSSSSSAASSSPSPSPSDEDEVVICGEISASLDAQQQLRISAVANVRVEGAVGELGEEGRRRLGGAEEQLAEELAERMKEKVEEVMGEKTEWMGEEGTRGEVEVRMEGGKVEVKEIETSSSSSSSSGSGGGVGAGSGGKDADGGEEEDQGENEEEEEEEDEDQKLVKKRKSKQQSS